MDCQTAYPSRQYLSLVTITALAGVNILVAVTNILFNAFLIYALFKTKQIRKLSSRLILYLSVSDCCVGALLQPIVVVILLQYKTETNCPVELLAQSIAFVFPQFSAVQIMIIALDRFLRMKFLHHHRKYMTRRRGTMMVVFNLSLSLTLAITSVIAGTHGQFYMFNVVLASIDSFVVMMIFVLYTFTYFSVHHHVSQARKREKLRNQDIKMSQISKLSKTSKMSSKSMSSVSSVSSKHRADSALAKTMLFILASLGLCYIPYLVLGVTWSYLQFEKGEVSRRSLAAFTWVSLILVYLNSTINAVIFATRNAKIMELFRSLAIRHKSLPDFNTTSELSSDK